MGTIPPPARTLNVVVAIFRRDEGLIAVAAIEVWSHGRYVHGLQIYTAAAVLWAAHMTAILLLVQALARASRRGEPRVQSHVKVPDGNGDGWQFHCPGALAP